MDVSLDIISSLNLSHSEIDRMDDKARDVVLSYLENYGTKAAVKIKNNIFISQTKGGGVWSARGDKTVHYTSLPFAPPNEDTGNLRRNVKLTRTPFDLVLSSEAKNKRNKGYSSWLEEGTKKMKPRPFFLEPIKDIIGLIMRTSGEGVLKRGRIVQLQYAIKNHLESRLRNKGY